MKKYLICGATALIAGLFITSCTHDDLDSRSIIEQKTQNYDAAFKSLYGEIAPGHTWGFDIPEVEPSGIIPASSRASSRAFTRTAKPNANEWAGTYTSVPTPLTDAQKDLVRRYFQQNKNPQGTSVTYSNFFVQQVYRGHTALSDANSDCTEQYTAGNGDIVYGSNQMDKLTAGIKEDHIYNFNHADYSYTDNNENKSYVNVWTGEIRNNDPNDKVYQQDQIMLMEESSTDCFGFYNSEESGQYNDHYVIITGDAIMTWAKTAGAKLSDAAKGANVAGMFFVGFDFESNKQAYNADGSLNINTNQYLVTFCDQNTPNAVQIPNSTRWATIGGADGYYSDWIVRITEGKKKTNDGDNNQGGPGTSTTSHKKTLVKRHVLIDKGRIFCEDLSSVTDVKEDIDFNDVVFDAIIWYDYWIKIEKNDQNVVIDTLEVIDEEHPDSLWADISLLATGATEQVKIDNVEVHEKFGETVKTMVNTVGASSNVFGSYKKDPVIPKNFRIDINFNIPNDWDKTREIYMKKNITLDNIPITVFWNTNGAGRAAANLAAGTVKFITDENGDTINLSMLSPHKIKVPLGTQWPAERRNIQEGYPGFSDYVTKEIEPWDNEESFYLYEYNWNLLAHRDLARHKYYYSDETEIIDGSYEGKSLWTGPNKGEFHVTIAASELTNATSTSKIRIYLTTPSNGYWHIVLQNKDWSGGLNIPEWNNSNQITYNPQPSDFPGYVEFNLSDGVKSSITGKGGFVIQTANNTEPFSVDCITFIQ